LQLDELIDIFLYRDTRCLALSAVDLTFSLRSLVTTLVVDALAAGLVVFLALAVAAAAAACCCSGCWCIFLFC
jgi:hypothetical protein